MASPAGPSSELKGVAKLKEVEALLEKLKVNLAERKLNSEEQQRILEKLKVFGRKVESADAIFTSEGIDTLCRYGLDGEVGPASKEALRCLANALFLVPKTRQTLVDLDYPRQAAQRLRSDDRDMEFLLSRILFLTTYDTTLDYDRLMDEQHLADTINANLARHARQYEANSGESSGLAQDEMALSETLKLLFNVTHHYPRRAHAFSDCVPSVLTLLSLRKQQDRPLDPPVNFLVNSLLNLEFDDEDALNFLFPKSNPSGNAERLINLLDRCVATSSETELDQLAAPLITLLRRVYELAPDGVKEHMQRLLLPLDDERSQPLGKSDTLSSRLLRLSTSPMTPALRDNIASLFFELSGKDAKRFVHNVGYGYASGYLMKLNIPVPQDILGGLEGDGEKSGTESDPVNPITGQRISAEAVSDLPEMAEGEKEREAERLFVLFERLKQTGIIDVKNPVEQALDEGRLEEVDE